MGSIVKLSQSDSNKEEFFRAKKNSFLLRVKVFSGKEGKIFTMYSPSLNVSGYGNTEAESDESLTLSVDLFCESLSEMNSKQRDQVLTKLGWERVQYKNKNYSKSYIDEVGVLQNFDPGTVTTKFIEKAIA